VWCMVYGVWRPVGGKWCMVHGVCHVVYGAWCAVRGEWCLVYGVWNMVCRVCRVAYSIWCMVWGVWYTVRGVLCRMGYEWFVCGACCEREWRVVRGYIVYAVRPVAYGVWRVAHERVQCGV
jgi:hypothetical protein